MGDGGSRNGVGAELYIVALGATTIIIAVQYPIKKGDKMEFFEEKECICVRDENGTVVAEVVFPEEVEDAVCITRTYVEEGL